MQLRTKVDLKAAKTDLASKADKTELAQLRSDLLKTLAILEAKLASVATKGESVL